MHIKKFIEYIHLLTQMPSSECQGEIVGHLQQASHPRVLTKMIPLFITVLDLGNFSLTTYLYTTY